MWGSIIYFSYVTLQFYYKNSKNVKLIREGYVVLHILVEVKMGIYTDVNGLEYELFDLGEDFLTEESTAVFRSVNRERYADNNIVYTCKYSDFQKLFKFVREVDKSIEE